jgi:molybdopterin converting factor small subunit
MTGTREDHLELPEAAHIRDAVSKAAELHPRVAKVKDIVRAALNGTMTTENLELHDGDTLSLMAPIVGG